MIVNRHHLTLEMEVVKWLLLVAFAIIAALAMVTALAAAEPMIDPMHEPARLPADVEMLARPMDAAPARPYFPEEGPADAPEYELPPAALAARVWMILETQQAGLAREALAGWQQIRLPGQAEAWREVAMAAANLTAGNFPRAAMHLDNARESRTPRRSSPTTRASCGWNRRLPRPACPTKRRKERCAWLRMIRCRERSAKPSSGYSPAASWNWRSPGPAKSGSTSGW